MIKARLISFVFLFFAGILPVFLIAQDVAALLRQARSLEKSFRDDEALQKYREIVRIDPDNIDALCRTSELYSIVGKRQSSRDKQKEYYKAGKEYALRALKVNPNYSEANFAMAISMGRIALISSGDEKIKAVKEIKNYADRCIKSNPSNFKGYHVLGKWHYEVSDLNALERWLVKVTYGGLPKSTLDDAIKNYEKSRQLNPAFLLNYLELATAYNKKGDKKKARALLEHMLKLPLATSDDEKIKSLGRKLLDEL
jgi:tetratricopeptide (TPR) repeat protein